MLRIQPIANAKAAESYYSKSDGGYYLNADDLGREWVGRGATMLGLKGSPDFEQFKRLIHGLDPVSGDQLTAKLVVDHRIPGWDVNLHCSKGVTIAMERGDSRLQEAFWEAARETVADLERFATTRIRKGGAQEDRLTGNLVGYAVEHPETRPAKEDGMPDPHRHIHIVLMNLTYDGVEKEWKAVKFRPIMDERKYFDRRFNQRFAAKAIELGYEVETKWGRASNGSRKYEGWDIKGIPDSVQQKFSRRSAEIEKLAADLGVTNPVAKDKLGATSRQSKRKDLTLADYRQYWNSRITPDESREIAGTIKSAILGQNARPEPLAEKGMEFAIKKNFERRSVVPLTELEITAMEHSMGASRPQDIERATKNQGLLIRDGEATTKEVLAEESRIIAFARDGRSTCRPLCDNPDRAVTGDRKLSADQQAVLRHIWESTDRLIMVEGDAGTGKTDAMQVTIPGIDKPGVFLAPSATASRDQLREKEFTNADTIARFLIDTDYQEQARDGYIYIDEAPLAGISDIDKVLKCAGQLNARVILQGDRKQHASVQRGSLFPVLEEYAGIPVARLTEIWRQTNKRYKNAVATIAKGNLAGGFDQLNALGWVKETPAFDANKPLVDEYMAGIEDGKSMLVVAPTHREGDEITEAIRTRLKEYVVDGKPLLGGDDKTFPKLKPLGWTEAERGDLAGYTGDEIIQFHRNSGAFKAGQRVTVSQLAESKEKLRPEHFSVYSPGELKLAPGDTIRLTGGGKTKDGKHKLNNGTVYALSGFTGTGDLRLSNGWIIDKSFGLLTHGYTTTSHNSQSKTEDRVIIAMGRQSIPAVNAQQFYVSASRGREKCTIFTDLAPSLLRQAIQRAEHRKSATELMATPKPKPGLKDRAVAFMNKVRSTFGQLRRKAEATIGEIVREREHGYVR